MIRLGLIAASRIAEHAVVLPCRDLDGIVVTAVAARDGDRARAAAERWGVGAWFGSYHGLIESDAVDAVYVATPASLHRRPVLAAIAAGKHVLCEKPFAANGADAATMAAAARGTDLVVMEAFHWRYHPLVEQMTGILARLGAQKRLRAWFDVPEGRIGPSDIRWDLSLGGGSTMDLGCYPISLLRWAAGTEPEVVAARAESTVDGVDAWLEADLDFDGVPAVIGSSMVAPARGNGLIVEGSEATMRVDNPVAPQHGSRIVVESRAGTEVIEVESTSTYLHQLRAFRDAIANRAPLPTGVEHAVANMRVVDDCYRMAGLEPRPTG